MFSLYPSFAKIHFCFLESLSHLSCFILATIIVQHCCGLNKFAFQGCFHKVFILFSLNIMAPVSMFSLGQFM